MTIIYDLRIRNGTIVDGTGRPGYIGDVGIRDGVLVDIGDAVDPGREEVDATGLVVAPGFFDIHTHYDAQIVWDPWLSHSPWHGVTTIVMGNCAVGFAPCREADRDFMMHLNSLVEGIPYESLQLGMGDWGFETYPQYLDFIEHRGTAINVVSQIGHHPVKVWTMGRDAIDRYADEREMAEQRKIVAEALAVGAAGFTIYDGPSHWGPGSKPVPSRLTTREQFESFVELVAAAGHGVFDTVWGPTFNADTIPGYAERYGITFMGPQSTTWDNATNYSGSQKTNAIAKESVRRGVPWFPQIGVLSNSFEVGLEDPFMFAIDQPLGDRDVRPLHDLFEPLAHSTNEEKLAAYCTPEFRKGFIEQTDRSDWNVRYWPLVVVSFAPGLEEFEGCRLTELARERDAKPASIMLDLVTKTNLAARFIIENPQNEGVLLEMLADDHDTFCIGASDAGAHQGQIADYRHPTYLLGHIVRDKGFPLERAVQMLTSRQARAYGILDRGVLHAGMAADVTIFDPQTVRDGQLQRVNDLPGGARRLFSPGVGIEHVLVNGRRIMHRGEIERLEADGLPGALIRDFAPHRELATR
jgi:N-acyl-D-aspartate/D-glutamate deacylase